MLAPYHHRLVHDSHTRRRRSSAHGIQAASSAKNPQMEDLSHPVVPSMSFPRCSSLPVHLNCQEKCLNWKVNLGPGTLSYWGVDLVQRLLWEQ